MMKLVPPEYMSQLEKISSPVGIVWTAYGHLSDPGPSVVYRLTPWTVIKTNGQWFWDKSEDEKFLEILLPTNIPLYQIKNIG